MLSAISDHTHSRVLVRAAQATVHGQQWMRWVGAGSAVVHSGAGYTAGNGNGVRARVGGLPPLRC